MMVPPDTNIRAFIDKYFIEDAMPDEPVIDEDVRIVYYDTEGAKLGTPHVTKKYLAMDIYTRDASLYNAAQDRLQRRDKLIAQRIKELGFRAVRWQGVLVLRGKHCKYERHQQHLVYNGRPRQLSFGLH